MAGSPGAQVIEALSPRVGEREFVSPKRAYGAFDNTGLGEKLRALGVDEVILAGQHTHICVRHSSYGALIRGMRSRSLATPSVRSKESTKTTLSTTYTASTAPQSQPSTSS